MTTGCRTKSCGNKSCSKISTYTVPQSLLSTGSDPKTLPNAWICSHLAPCTSQDKQVVVHVFFIMAMLSCFGTVLHCATAATFWALHSVRLSLSSAQPEVRLTAAEHLSNEQLLLHGWSAREKRFVPKVSQKLKKTAVFVCAAKRPCLGRRTSFISSGTPRLVPFVSTWSTSRKDATFYLACYQI